MKHRETIIACCGHACNACNACWVPRTTLEASKALNRSIGGRNPGGPALDRKGGHNPKGQHELVNGLNNQRLSKRPPCPEKPVRDTMGTSGNISQAKRLQSDVQVVFFHDQFHLDAHFHLNSIPKGLRS